MAAEYDEDLHVPHGISVGNWVWGNIIVQPQAGERTVIDITGLNLSGQGDIYPQASVKSAWPWTSAGHVSIGIPEGGPNQWEAGETQSFKIVFSRVNESETRIHWMVWRDVQA